MKKRFRFLLLGAVSILSALALLAGCASPTAAQPDSPRQTAASQEVQLEVPYLSQEDILPTGCEAVSAAMVLQYWGVDVTPEEVASMLPCAPLYQLRGQLYGPNPDEFFVGSPFEETGYGCYAPVIAGVLEEQLPPKYTVTLEYGCTIRQLYQNYVVEQGAPVLIWVTIDLVEPTPGTQWQLEDGSLFTWKKDEHCMVLTGKQGDRYLCQDPYESHGTVSLPEDLLQLRFEQMGSQAVAVVES